MKRQSVKFAVNKRRALIFAAAGLALLREGAAGAASPDVFSYVPDRPVAPDFSLEDADRRSWRLSALTGHVVVVNFWASWCPPCRRELPSLENLYRIAGPKGVVVLGINAGETWDTVAAFTVGLEPALTFPILLDEKGDVLKTWQVKGLPVTYVVDRSGRIVLRALGGRDFSRPDAIQDVSKLTQGK